MFLCSLVHLEKRLEKHGGWFLEDNIRPPLFHCGRGWSFYFPLSNVAIQERTDTELPEMGV